MLAALKNRQYIKLWQFLFIVFSTSWLLAPFLNHSLSDRVGLISQYEMPSQPYAWLFITGDLAGGALLIFITFKYIARRTPKLAALLLLVIGIGMFADSLLPTTCHLRHGICYEYYSLNFLLHAIESVVTALAIFILALYDSWLRKRLVSVFFVIFQALYGLLSVSQLATEFRFNTVSQFAYQSIVVLWIAWYVADNLIQKDETPAIISDRQIVKSAVAIWAFLNGLAAIVISLTHLNLVGRIQRFYFVGDNAWLAQHSVVVGVALLYLSRHLWRGESRARQIFLVIAAIETLNYSVISPNLPLLLLYLFTFCALFVTRDAFDRGNVALTWRVRLQDLLFMLGSLIAAALIALSFLYQDERLARIAGNAFDRFLSDPLRLELLSKAPHLPSALLAQTLSVFLLASILSFLWILFRPSRNILGEATANHQLLIRLLHNHSTTPDDYFKLWPSDKQYFWSADEQCFIAYKIVGPVAFVLADPIGTKAAQARALADFLKWTRAHRFTACFLSVYETSLSLYKSAGLNTMQVGASAVVDIEVFTQTTASDKWWRWQKNRALKQEYQYAKSQPPHTFDLLEELRKVSDAWLTKNSRKERGFALGYFDQEYLGQCTIHYLKNSDSSVAAFTNQLPNFKHSTAVTIDLLRHLPEANNAMPYLLLKTIEDNKAEDTPKFFDLGFVPFTKAKGPIIAIARALSAGGFSARGLEQFKNKYDPVWQPNYMAYDGDIADLAIIALHLEKAMSVPISTSNYKD